MGRAKKSRHGGAGDKIVPTGVTNTRQSVVFSTENDLSTARSQYGFKARFKPVSMLVNLEAERFQVLDDGIVCEELLIRGFWICVKCLVDFFA